MITLADVVRAVRDIAYRDPGYAYPHTTSGRYACVYVERAEDGSLRPSCLIGRALAQTGVALERLDVALPGRQMLLHLAHGGVLQRWWAEDVDAVPWHMEPEVLWLGLVQDLQDTGIAWGEVVARADEAVPFGPL